MSSSLLSPQSFLPLQRKDPSTQRWLLHLNSSGLSQGPEEINVKDKHGSSQRAGLLFKAQHWHQVWSLMMSTEHYRWVYNLQWTMISVIWCDITGMGNNMILFKKT